MKSVLLPLLLIVASFSSCKKNNDCIPQADLQTSLTNSVVTKSGQLVFTAKENSVATVKIYRLQNGKYLLALEQVNYKSNIDFNVYLSATPGLSGSSLKLFSAKDLQGTVYYELPSSIDPGSFGFIIIQNDISDEPIASGELN